MKFSVVSALSALMAVASALTPADTSQPPSGNPISLPGLNELVPVGKPYTITWTPTTQGKVSIVLLRGPSTNVVPIATIADAIENTGTYVWTPSTSLENDVTHYGLQIIVEGTGQYQYSTQFGIKNDGPPPSSSSSGYASNPPASSSASYSSSSKSSLVPISTYTTVICTSVAPSGTAPTAKPTAPPTSLKVTPTPTPSSPPSFKGAAGHNAASLGGVIVALAAVLAF